MPNSNRQLLWSVFLISIVLISLLNVKVALADDSTPPLATPEPIQPPVGEASSGATMSTQPEPQLSTTDVASVAELLADVPQSAEIVLLDANGNVVPLVSQEAIAILEEADPMWCPEGVLPNGAGCTGNLTISALLALMQTNTGGKFNADGVIYFERSGLTIYNTAFILDNSATSLGASFSTISTHNITLKGGWNGGVTSTFDATQSSEFDNNNNAFIRIGSSGNPWTGNVTLQDFFLEDNIVSSNPAVAVYTTSGSVTLNDVDVNHVRNSDAIRINTTTGNITLLDTNVTRQADGYTANLTSQSGNILISNGSSFDGDNTGATNKGFSATTNTGSITVTGTSTNRITFTDALGPGTGTNYNGASLSAPVVTLNYVTADDNDLNGIAISNANIITLNNVISTRNGTNIAPGFLLDLGSGVRVDGNPGSSVFVYHGTFTGNRRYGIEVSNTTLFIGSSIDNCTTPQNGGGCTNVIPVTDLTPPVLTLPANMTVEATGASGSVATYSASALDAVDGPRPVSCSPASGSTFPIGTTTVNCSTSDTTGNTANGSFTVTVHDTTPPVLALPANMMLAATSALGATASFSPTATDLVNGPRTVTCNPASGSLFPLGTTFVNCSSSDLSGNMANGSFTVTVHDTSAPILTLPANMTLPATSMHGATSFFSASAMDLVDGPRPVTCNPTSGDLFPVGITIVNCSSSDTSGNTGTGSFTVTVSDYIPRPHNANHSTGSAGLILVTGGKLIDLDCTSVANAFGIIVRFYNLCDHQALLNEVAENVLPGALPNGFTFVQGLDVKILENGQVLGTLPNGTAVEMDFPLPGGSEFAVLFWDGGQWVEIKQLMNAGDLDNVMATDADNELYKMSSSRDTLFNILTTEKTGIFVLVSK